MAVPIPGINAYTHNFIVKSAYDTVYASSPPFVRFSKQKRNAFRGGLLVQHPLIVGELKGGAVGPGEGAPGDLVTTETALQMAMKLYLVNVPLLGFNAMQNDGDAAVFTEVEMKFANAAAQMVKMLATDMYLTSASSLGRARRLAGFEEWVDDGNTYTTIGGITRSDLATAGTVAGMNSYVAALTSFSLKALNTACTQSWIGNKHVDLIIATKNGWDQVWNSLQPMQQNVDKVSDVAQAGFATIRFQQAELVVDMYAPTGTSGRMWGINSEAIKWFWSVNPLFNLGFTGFKGTSLGIDTHGQYLAGNTLLIPGARQCFKLTSATLF